jgi:hypothetical protein
VRKVWEERRAREGDGLDLKLSEPLETIEASRLRINPLPLHPTTPSGVRRGDLYSQLNEE